MDIRYYDLCTWAERMASNEAVCSSSSGESLCSNIESEFSEVYTSDDNGQGEVVLVPSRKVRYQCMQF